MCPHVGSKNLTFFHLDTLLSNKEVKGLTLCPPSAAVGTGNTWFHHNVGWGHCLAVASQSGCTQESSPQLGPRTGPVGPWPLFFAPVLSLLALHRVPRLAGKWVRTTVKTPQNSLQAHREDLVAAFKCLPPSSERGLGVAKCLSRQLF